MPSSVPTPLYTLLLVPALAAALSYQPCPLRGPLYPPASNLSASPVFGDALQNLTADIQAILDSGDSAGHPASRTTSLSVVLFSADNSTTDEDPLLYQFHYTAPATANSSEGTRAINADSVYPIADISMVFTTWLFIIEGGHQYWERPVTDFVPELASMSGPSGSLNVDWAEITLGDLAGHMSGIGRDYGFMDLDGSGTPMSSFGSNKTTAKPPCGSQVPCSKEDFLHGITSHAPVYSAATTPIYSHAAFQLLGYALNNITGGSSYEALLSSKILQSLGLTSTSATPPQNTSSAVVSTNLGGFRFNQSLGDLSPALGIYSTPRDLAAAGRAMLQSKLNSASEARRWFQPQAFTSNLVNTVGRPWEIYAGASSLIKPIVPTFTKQGWLGAYTTYLGLVPDYGVGFAILASDDTGSADLNALADIVGADILPAVVAAAEQEAAERYAGQYSAGGTNGTSTMVIKQDDLPGLSVEQLTSDGKDVRSAIAQTINIIPSNLDMRIYPTDLRTVASNRTERFAWRAVFQDVTAPVDAGTPTCVTWQNVDQLVLDGVALDYFIFENDVRTGSIVGVEMPALEQRYTKL